VSLPLEPIETPWNPLAGFCMLTVAERVQAAQGSHKGEPGAPARMRAVGLVRQSFNSGQLNLRRDERNRCTAAVCEPKTALK
jgi:hypothetical protein